jgi:hypothetical protein
MLDLLVRDHQAWGDGPESKGPGGDQGQEEQEFEPRARRLRCMTHGKTSQAGSLGGIAQDQIVLKKRPTGGKRLATLILSGKTDLSPK